MKNSKIILIGTGLLLTAVIMFPPFHFIGFNGATFNRGFAFILSSPHDGYATVNTSQLFIQVLVVLSIGVLAWLFVREK